MSAFFDYVQKMQGRTYEALPYGHWDDLRWPLKTNQSASDAHRRAVIFTPEEGASAGFSEPFATLARALICNMAASKLFLGSSSPFTYLMAALRVLYASIPEGLAPERIEEDHFVAAEGLAKKRYPLIRKGDGLNTNDVSLAAVNVAVKLQWIVGALKKSRIAPNLDWTRTLRQTGEVDEDLEKLLTDEQAMAWAALSARNLSASYDRIRQRLVDLMMCTGFRVNEVCTLPRDTLVNEARIDEEGEIVLDAGGDPIIWTGLRYWPEKGGSGQTCIKPIPTVMVPIVERAVEEILRDTARAHASAEAHAKSQSPFESDPRWAHLPPKHEMWPDEVAAMLGLKGNMVVRGREFIRNYQVPHRIVPDKRGTRTYNLEQVTKAAVEAALRKTSFLGDCVPRERGTPVPLHECLFILPVAIRSDRPGFTGSARLIADHEILSFLGGKTRFASAFARYGIAGSEEKKFLPRQARSWLTTIASEEAVHPLDIARWMGWTKVESVASYDLRSRKKREASARRDLMGSTDPSILRQRPPLGPKEEAFADDVAGHVTSAGICRATFDEDPCNFLSAGLESGRWQEGVAAMTPKELARLILRLKRQKANATIAQKDDVKAKTWLGLTLKLLEKAEAVSAAKQRTDRWAS